MWEHSESMRVVFIGAGRLASCLAPALQRGGAEVLQVWSRSEASAQALASTLCCPAVWGALDGVCRDADVYLLCVRDDVISDVARSLRAIIGLGPIVAHTSGGTALDDIIVGSSDHVGVFYPLQSFTRGRKIDFSEVHFFLEAIDDTTYCRLTALAALLTSSSHIHRLATADRRRMHLAAVFVSNFVNHCCVLAEDILQPTGLDFKVMRPLLAETVSKLDVMTPVEAQTGPALRWDERVLDAHRELLIDLDAMRALYDMLSQSIHKKAIDSQ